MRCRLIVPSIFVYRTSSICLGAMSSDRTLDCFILYTRFSLSNHKFTSLSNPATFVCHIRLIVCETQIGAKSFDRTSHCFIILSDHKSKFFSNPSIFVYRTSSICLSAPNRWRSYVCALMSALLCLRSYVGALMSALLCRRSYVCALMLALYCRALF